MGETRMVRRVTLVAVGALTLMGQQCANTEGAEQVTPNGSRLVLPSRADPVAFDTATVRIVSGADTFLVLAELARTGEQKERGLMFRTAMPDTAGMLFLYDAPFEGSFWMLDTAIPLSIALADSTGVIQEILEMEPCVDRFSYECPVYDATEPFQYALEVNQGYFARHGIRPGARLAWRH